MNLHRYSAALLCAVALTACEKNAVQVITAPVSGAFVRFANFGVNAPAVNFYANDKKLTAISTANCTPPTNPLCTTTGVESTAGVASGAFAVTSGLYSSLTPGTYALTGKIAAATDKDLTVSTTSTSLENGKYYTFYMAGLYNTTAKTSESFVVEDPIPAQIDYANAQVRFVNAISNSSPMILYAKNTLTAVETAVGGAVAYKAAGAFATLAPGTYDLITRAAGSSTNIIQRLAVGFGGGRMYSVTARGDITVTSTTLATRPQLDNTSNR